MKLKFGILGACFAFGSFLWAIDKPILLKTNDKTNPIYIETPQPELSWTVQPGTATQNFYQLNIATSSDFGAVFWDSGKTASTANSCTYSGPELSGNTTYYWKVRLWEVETDTGPWSDPATFRMNFFLKKGNFRQTDKITAFGWGDLDNDGDIDLIVGTKGDTSYTRFLENDGGGNFSVRVSTQYGKDIGGIVVTDLNNDGLLDVIVGCLIDHISQNTASEVYINHGNFNFAMTQGLNDVKTQSILVYDINRDGYYDLIEGVETGGSAGSVNKIYFGNGNGTFSAAENICESNNTKSVAVADLNNDGYCDLISLNYYADVGALSTPQEKAIVYQGDGTGNFAKAWESETDYFSAVSPIDLDRNNSIDFVAATNKQDTQPGPGNYVTQYYNGGSFSFAGIDISDTGSEAHVPALARVDFNNDGWDDIIMAWMGGANNYTRVYRNEGGNLKLFERSETQTYAYALALADFNSDGFIDLLTGGEYGGAFYYSNTGTNTSPQPPSNLTFEWRGGELYLGWDGATDAETHQNLLQYNLKLSDETQTILSPFTGPIFSESAGLYGNVGPSSWTVLNIPRKTYFFSVQTIDGYGGTSGFSTTLTVNEKAYPGWDTENLLLSTCTRQYTKAEVLSDPSLEQGEIKINFRVKDYEKNKVTLGNFGYSIDGGTTWTDLPDDDSSFEGFSPDEFNTDDNFLSAPAYTFNWKTTFVSDPILIATHTYNARIRFKAYDGYEWSDYCYSQDFELDNLGPTAPGNLTSSGRYTADSVTLNFGSQSADTNFDEYIIYYNLTTPVNETDNIGQWDSTEDPNLGFADFNGASSTTITGLNENTTYYFIIYAYDIYGNNNYSPQVCSAKTNDIPSGQGISASQRTDGSGIVDFVFRGYDVDIDSWSYSYLRVKRQASLYTIAPYPSDPLYTQELVFSSTGALNHFVFNAKDDLGDIYLENAQIAMKVSDGINESAEFYSPTFNIDTKPPEGITAFKVRSYFSTSVELQWNLDDSDSEIDYFEDNLNRFEIWYGASPGVVNSSPTFSCQTFSPTVGTELRRTAEVKNLYQGVRYYFKMYVWDDFGNVFITDEVSQVTGAGPDSNIVSANPRKDGSGIIEMTVSMGHPDGFDSFLQVVYSTVSDNGPWSNITVLSPVCWAVVGSTKVLLPEIGYSNTAEYQLGSSSQPIITSSGTVELFFNWLSRQDLPDFEGTVYMTTVVKDIKGVQQYVKKIFGPFTIDNLDPAVLGASYSHGSEIYDNLSADLRIYLNQAPSSMDFSKLYITTYPWGGQTYRIEISSNEYNESISSSTLYLQLTQQKWEELAMWSRLFPQIYLNVSSATFVDNWGNFVKATSTLLSWQKDENPPSIQSVSYGKNPETGYSGLKFQFSENVSSISQQGVNSIKLYFTQTGTSAITFEDGLTISTTSSKRIYWFYPTQEKHIQIITCGKSTLYLSCGEISQDYSGNKNNVILQEDAFGVNVEIETDPPTVSSYFPNGSEKVSPQNLTVRVVFSEPMYEPSITQDAFLFYAVRNSQGQEISVPVSFTVSYDANTKTAYLYPLTDLEYGYKYEVTVKEQVQDLYLNNMASPFFWDFETRFDLAAGIKISSGCVEIEISPNALSGAGEIRFYIDSIDENILNAFNNASLYDDFAHHRITGTVTTVEILDENGIPYTGEFQNDAYITFYYKDDDGDDVVDETSPPVRVTSLAIYWLSGDRWIKVPTSTLIKEEKKVRALVKHFSTYALMGSKIFELSSVHPYPVPYRKWEDLLGNGITFTGLPSEATIEIYSILGEKLKTFSYNDASASVIGAYQWSAIDLPSGIYIYRILSGENEKRGKLVIVR